MEITRLYTESQFIDLADKKYLDANQKNPIAGYESLRSYWYNMILRWNNYLKQPLTEEMIFNKFEKPSNFTGGYNSFCHSDREKWQESESKVIFENGKQSWYEEG